MGLRAQAEQDLAFIVENTADFGWPITIKSPAGVSANLTGISNDIALAIDPQTGVPVSGRTATISLRMSSLVAANIALPYGVFDGAIKPFLVTFSDINGNSLTFKIKSADPDRTLGLVTCGLEFWRAA